MVFASSAFLFKSPRYPGAVRQAAVRDQRRRRRARVRVQRQSRLLQIYMPHNRFSEADEPVFAHTHKVRQGKMRVMRQMQGRLSNGRRRYRQLPQAQKRHGMHTLHGMRESLPQKSAVAASLRQPPSGQQLEKQQKAAFSAASVRRTTPGLIRGRSPLCSIRL